MNTINRREALKKTAYVMGGALMVPTVAGVLKGCTPKPELTWTPTFFSENQAKMVTAVADIIMPRTDTPAASELGVPGFMEEMVSTVFPEKDRDDFMTSIGSFEEACMAGMGKSFLDLNAEKRAEFVTTQHSKIEGMKNLSRAERPFIWKAKELTILGYCLTEVGSTQLLQHVFIPTRYDGCVPLTETGNGKTWAM